jgi:hypothetical protein
MFMVFFIGSGSSEQLDASFDAAFVGGLGRNIDWQWFGRESHQEVTSLRQLLNETIMELQTLDAYGDIPGECIPEHLYVCGWVSLRLVEQRRTDVSECLGHASQRATELRNGDVRLLQAVYQQLGGTFQCWFAT